MLAEAALRLPASPPIASLMPIKLPAQNTEVYQSYPVVGAARSCCRIRLPARPPIASSIPGILPVQETVLSELHFWIRLPAKPPIASSIPGILPIYGKIYELVL